MARQLRISAARILVIEDEAWTSSKSDYNLLR